MAYNFLRGAQTHHSVASGTITIPEDNNTTHR